MSQYIVTASGCDDATNALVDLSSREHAVFVRVAAQLNARSTCSCMPRLSFTPLGEATPDQIDAATEPLQEGA